MTASDPVLGAIRTPTGRGIRRRTKPFSKPRVLVACDAAGHDVAEAEAGNTGAPGSAAVRMVMARFIGGWLGTQPD